MLVSLPLIAFTVFILCLVARGCNFRAAFLGAAVCFGLLLTIATELLSLFSAITYFSLATFWGVVAFVALLCFVPKRSCLKNLNPRFDNPGILVMIGAVLATTLLIALVAPPNNWDSMTYHMARVVHWIQNQSVAHYPTHITRQLYSAPWAEFAIMNLQILSGGDRFANLVQWFAMCGSIIGTSLIAREVGASSRIQGLAAIVAATIPMGILQASSTQNDFVVSFWLVCFVYFGMLLGRNPSLVTAVACGGSLGLAILTKGTAYIFALPFLMWLLFAGLKTNRYIFVKYVLIAAVIAISLNTGHYLRNYALWGNPLTTDGDKLTNEHVTFQATISNLTRNIASNTWTPFASANELEFQGVKLAHDLLDIDINDPATSLNNETFSPGSMSRDEDYAGNALHLLLLLVSIAVLFLRRKSLSRSLPPYALSLASGFLIYCMLLKWQPWGTRLQLPLFVLAAPLIAIAMPLNGKRWAVTTCAAFMFLCSIPWLVDNQTRPILGNRSILRVNRESLYFAKRPQLEPYYSFFAEQYISRDSCNTIGIMSSSGNSYDYPFWALLSKRTATMPRIEHINVSNISSSIPLRNFKPCFIFEIH